MKLAGAVVVVTGGAHGIGAALCRRFAAEGAKAVVVADRDAAGAEGVAAEIGGTAVTTDVAREADIAALVARTRALHGDIDLFASNAGIAFAGGIEAPDSEWQRIWDINLMSHVWAARAVLPHMLERGRGYLLQTASAAGLLSNIGAAPYAVTKHAAVALAEWLSITYGDRGIKVSCLCPQGVRTELLMSGRGQPASDAVLAAGTLLEPADVAESVVRGLEDERFLILPHPEVAGYFQTKATDYERWLTAMRRLQKKVTA